MVDKINEPQEQPGLFVKGLAISNSARLIHRKDGSGSSVAVTHEISTQPGVVEYTRYFEVGKDTEIKVQGEEIKEYPKFPEMKHVSLKILSWKAFDKRFVVKIAEIQTNNL